VRAADRRERNAAQPDCGAIAAGRFRGRQALRVDHVAVGAKQSDRLLLKQRLGEDVIIVTSVSDGGAKKMFPHGWKAPRPYLRVAPQPK
jgi:hypothetical protein